MFCPTCGREDSQGRKFCPACGANLERVTKALSPGGDDLLVRSDQAFDRLIARYAGLFFGGAQDRAIDWRVSHSWMLWAQAFLALPANFILFWIMLFGILPLRLITLLFGSPFRLLSERSSQQGVAPEAKVENRRAQLQAPPPGQWLMDSAPSAVEHTTMNLLDSAATEHKGPRAKAT
ncbi:MAG: zinc ribbon domain-containing protein [Blastocatellales bacterium]